jgi:RNA-directed DNA polymerase
MSPLLANIALSVLDEHLHKPWRPGGTMSTAYLRSRRRVHGLPRWRIVRYADDFVILVHGERAHAEAYAKTSPSCSHPWVFDSPSPKLRWST